MQFDHPPDVQEEDRTPAPESAVTDPVCGMSLDPSRAFAKEEQGSRTYWFCSSRCLEKFRAEPSKYAGYRLSASSKKYTCPMHPEVLRDVPGNCPNEPVTPTASAANARREYTCPMRR